jgi:hypothetical protein
LSEPTVAPPSHRQLMRFTLLATAPALVAAYAIMIFVKVRCDPPDYWGWARVILGPLAAFSILPVAILFFWWQEERKGK